MTNAPLSVSPPAKKGVKEHTAKTNYKFFNTVEFAWDETRGTWLPVGFLEKVLFLFKEYEAKISGFALWKTNESNLGMVHRTATVPINGARAQPTLRRGRAELHFLRFWLDELILWEGYALWNGSYNPLLAANGDSRDAEKEANKLLIEFESNFL